MFLRRSDQPLSGRGSRFVEAVKLGEAAFERGEYLRTRKWESGSTGCSALTRMGVTDGGPVVNASCSLQKTWNAYFSASRKTTLLLLVNGESHL